MLTRRDGLRYLLWAGAGVATYPLLTACGDAPPPTDVDPGETELVSSDVSRSLAGAADRPAAASAVQAFTADLFGALGAKPGNLVFSPYSVAVALAMTRNGARGDTATEMDAVLHAPTLGTYNAGMNALTRHIEGLAGPQVKADGKKAEVALDVANSLWGQRDTEWEADFLDALAVDYGTGMRLVDYISEAEAARLAINGWTADQTHDKIPELIPMGVLDELTRLVLVNAIYLKAPWEQPFEVRVTQAGRFTRSDGSTVQTDLMTGTMASGAYARGDGWQAGQLPYAGGGLAMTVIVPDEGRLDELEGRLGGPELATILAAPQQGPELHVTMPPWKIRANSTLNQPLKDLGMPTAFTDAADFSGMTREEQLYISAVLHEAFIAVDEEGTEAAAATAVVVDAVSLSASVQLVADRAFCFVIHDTETMTPLFVGRVDDPTAG